MIRESRKPNKVANKLVLLSDKSIVSIDEIRIDKFMNAIH